MEDVPFDPGLSNYANPQSMQIPIQDPRGGANTLLILGGTVIFPDPMHTCSPDDTVVRPQVRFVVPQINNVITSRAQIKSMLVVTATASLWLKEADHVIAVDQATIDWNDTIHELQVTADLAISQGCYRRLMYLVFVLAQVRIG